MGNSTQPVSSPHPRRWHLQRKADARCVPPGHGPWPPRPPAVTLCKCHLKVPVRPPAEGGRDSVTSRGRAEVTGGTQEAPGCEGRRPESSLTGASHPRADAPDTPPQGGLPGGDRPASQRPAPPSGVHAEAPGLRETGCPPPTQRLSCTTADLLGLGTVTPAAHGPRGGGFCSPPRSQEGRPGQVRPVCAGCFVSANGHRSLWLAADPAPRVRPESQQQGGR